MDRTRVPSGDAKPATNGLSVAGMAGKLPEARDTSVPKKTFDPFQGGRDQVTPALSGASGSTMGFKALFLKHWLAVITYCAVFWSFGMCVAFLGPTLLDLGCLTGSDMRSISWVFFSQLLCSLLGASMAGYLVQRGVFTASADACDANYIILVAATLIPISMVVIPFCRVLPALALVLAVMGLNMGVIDCLANLQMIKLFGDAVPPFLQAMHFCYGLGAFVSPMIAEPFLLNEDCSPFIDNGTVTSSNALIEPSIEQVENDTSLPAHSLAEAQQMTNVRFAFWIMAATQLPIPALVVGLVVRLRMRGVRSGHSQLVDSDSSPSPSIAGDAKSGYGAIAKPPTQFDTADTGVTPTKLERCCGSRTVQVAAITGCTSVMLFIYDGLQSTYGGYVYSYAVKSIADLNTFEGAYLNALFWGTFALGRLISIPLATRFSPVFMLLCNIIGCLTSMTLMLAFRHDHVSLYIGTACYGIFLSSVAPTTISLAEQYIDLTSTITSVIVVMGAVGEMICPVIVGNMFVVVGPVSFLSVAEVLCMVSVGVFIAFWMVGRLTPKHKARDTKSFVWCKMCCIRKPIPDDDHVTQHVVYRQQTSEDSGSNIELDLAPKQRAS